MGKAQLKEREAEPDLLNNVAPPPAAKLPAKTTAAKPKNQVAKIEDRPASVLEAAMARVLRSTDDPAKMRELFQFYQETEAKQQFHDAILSIDFPAINRDGKIPVSGGRDLRFASFENVHRAVMGLLKNKGFRMSFAPMPGPGGQGMVVEVRLIRGTYEEKCIVPMSVAPASRAMNSQQAIGAAIKYASRYGIMYLLCLRSDAPDERDTDGVVTDRRKLRPAAGAAAEPETALDKATMNDPNPGGEPKISKAQFEILVKAVATCGVGVEKFCEHYAVDKVADLPASRFQEAMDACARFKPKTGER